MRKFIVLLVILGFVLGSGCSKKAGNGKTKGEITGEIAIEDIHKNPDSFYGKECVIRGLITQTVDVPVLSHDIFKINDGTGEIWVYTEKGALPDRIEVRISGKFQPFIKLPFKLPVDVEISHYIILRKLEFLRI